MSKLLKKKYFWIKFLRHGVQAASLILLHLGLWGYGKIRIPLPVLVNSSEVGASAPGAFEIVQRMLAEAALPLLPLGFWFLFMAILGRVSCGWICPFGFIQDMLSLIAGSKTRINRKWDSTAKQVKYWIALITILLASLVGLSKIFGFTESLESYLNGMMDAPFEGFSPTAILFGMIPYTHMWNAWPQPTEEYQGWMILALFDRIWLARIFTLLAIMIACVYISRFWCRYLCPVGAINGILGRFSWLDLGRHPARCTKCGECNRICPMQVYPMDRNWRRFESAECIKCLDCLAYCEYNAIAIRFP